MSFLERLTHLGMTREEWESFTVEIDADFYKQRASEQFGLDLAVDPSIQSTDDLRKKIDEAEKLGLDREWLYMFYFHGKVMVYFGRTNHEDCCPWYVSSIQVYEPVKVS